METLLGQLIETCAHLVRGEATSEAKKPNNIKYFPNPFLSPDTIQGVWTQPYSWEISNQPASRYHRSWVVHPNQGQLQSMIRKQKGD
jgi:hypothetical protein